MESELSYATERASSLMTCICKPSFWKRSLPYKESELSYETERTSALSALQLDVKPVWLELCQRKGPPRKVKRQITFFSASCSFDRDVIGKTNLNVPEANLT